MKKLKIITDNLNKLGILRSTEIENLGVSREYIRKLVKAGIIERLGRGIYGLPGAEYSRFRYLLEISKQIPRGVICLLSALSFHQLTTQLPHSVWIAIENNAFRPMKTGVSVNISYFSGRAFTEGLEEYDIEGSKVKIFNPAKTVADCFKYRNKIGVDVAVEALKDYLRQKKGTMDDLWYYGKICRVNNVMKPYVEAMI